MSFGSKAQLSHLIVAQLVQIRVHLFRQKKLCFWPLNDFERRFFGKMFNLPHVLEVFHCPHSQLKGCVLVHSCWNSTKTIRMWCSQAVRIFQPRRQWSSCLDAAGKLTQSTCGKLPPQSPEHNVKPSFMSSWHQCLKGHLVEGKGLVCAGDENENLLGVHHGAHTHCQRLTKSCSVFAFL